jgi:hypothetical protein
MKNDKRLVALLWSKNGGVPKYFAGPHCIIKVHLKDYKSEKE